MDTALRRTLPVGLAVPFVGIALTPAVAQLATFAYVLAARVNYPMDLEWLEGAQIYQAYRFARGLPVFAAPDGGYVPSPYPPLFHLVVAGIGRCCGFDYWNGRLVSDVSIGVVIAVLAAAVLRAAPSRRLGAVLATMGAACVAATYRPLGASMDLARADTMGVAVVAAAAACCRSPARLGWARGALLGLLLSAAVYTKQPNLFYVLWILHYVARRDRRGAVVAGAVALTAAVCALAALQRATGGWFWIWMMGMKHDGVVPARCLASALAVGAGAFALRRAWVALDRRGWLREPTRFWCGMLAASVGGSMPILAPAGWLNNLIGLVLIALVVAMLLICDVLCGIGTESAARVALATLAAFLLGALSDPAAVVPDAAARRDTATLHALVRSLPGDVLLPMYPFVAARDGRSTPQISLVAYLCTLGPGRINADAIAAIRQRDADWVVLFGHPDQERDVETWLAPRYTADPLDLHVQAFQEPTGGRVTLFQKRPPTD